MNRAFRPLLVLLLALLAGCRGTSEAERLATASETYAWTFDQVDQDLAEARAELVLQDRGPARDRLREEIEMVADRSRALRAELIEGVEEGRTEVLDRLYEPLMRLVERSGELRARARASSH